LVALPRRGFLRSSLDSVGDLGWSDSTAEDRQDFDRGISFWSRKVWKAVGGLDEEGFSSLRDRFLSLAVRLKQDHRTLRNSGQLTVLNLEAVTGGQVDFVDALQGDGTRNELSWHISDHFRLWVEFAIPAN
jgi:hypothetical protein